MIAVKATRKSMLPIPGPITVLTGKHIRKPTIIENMPMMAMRIDHMFTRSIISAKVTMCTTITDGTTMAVTVIDTIRGWSGHIITMTMVIITTTAMIRE